MQVGSALLAEFRERDHERARKAEMLTSYFGCFVGRTATSSTLTCSGRETA